MKCQSIQRTHGDATSVRGAPMACTNQETVRLQKEVRGHDLARRENAVARLAAVTPLSLFTLLLSSKNDARQRSWLRRMQPGVRTLQAGCSGG